jgi:hypothetical protein
MVDLGLDISRTRGRAAKPLAAVELRELTEADLALLETEKGVKPSQIKKIRESHHALARALAAGMKPGEAAIVTGYSQSRISILQADPAFQDLLTVYKEQVGDIYADTHHKMAALAVDAVEEMHDRLNEARKSSLPTSFSRSLRPSLTGPATALRRSRPM